MIYMTELIPTRVKALARTLGSILLLRIINPFVTIDSAERGILYRRWAVQDSVLWEGLHWKRPIMDKVKIVKVTPMWVPIEIPVAAQGAITKDNQTIGSSIVFFFRYKDTELINAAKNYWFDMLQGKATRDVTESFKQTIGQYTIFDVASKQEEIRKMVISGAIAKIGHYPVIIDDVKISNYDWSNAFDDQIAKTMQIAQETKQQEQELKKIEVSSQQQIKMAEAQKSAAILKAEADRETERLNAEGLKLKGEGIRDYNAALTANPKNMDLELKLKALEIEKILAEKWNGQRVAENNYGPIPVSYNPVQR